MSFDGNIVLIGPCCCTANQHVGTSGRGDRKFPEGILMNNVLVGISADEASTDSPGVLVATGLAAPGANCTKLEMATLTLLILP
jgi:hypothetical protein